MLGPDSRLLIALLIIGSAGLLFAAIRLRLVAVKALCGTLSIVVAMTGGIAVVNYYYGYYTTWGQLWADFHGGGTGDLAAITPPTSTTALGSGRLGWADLPGKLSGYDRRALVYLPPQYGEPKYAGVRFPVVELFHGTPGTSPLGWDTRLHIGQIADSLIARHLIGPMVLVMPTINGSGHNFQDCLNGPGLNDETYVTKDVRADVYAHYRVSHDPYEWGLAGYSSGGYCAVNLALRHPSAYGAAAAIDGYFRASDGPASAILKNNPSLEAANSPLSLAERLTQNSSPVPAFWIAAGTNDKIDYKPANVFAAVMNRIEQVPFVRLHNVGDTANGWYAALPTALTWLWQHLASPDLRAQFPVRAGNSGLSGTLIVPPLKGGHAPGPCVPAKRPGPPVSCGKVSIAQAQKA